MELNQIKSHGNIAVDHLNQAVVHLRAIKNDSLAEFLADISLMLKNNVEKSTAKQ